MIKRLYFKGYSYTIDRYWETEPKEIYPKCLKYKHISYKKYLKPPKYYIYISDYEAKDYKYLIIRYLTLIKRAYIYLFIKYIYYKDPYFAISNNCPKKKIAIKKTKRKKKNIKYLKKKKNKYK